jgi:alkanesulfonate monooxygenase SsuD/methylene tetrahydromethanopterin reductase-like flavin-dependent oxidoreductase (luciferase family)
VSEAAAFAEALGQMKAAEELGFDAVWLAEIHFQKDRSVLASPLVIAAALAACTRRIRIGIAVQVLPLSHPLRLAEDVATVDHLSKGRLEFGVGRSGLPGLGVPVFVAVRTVALSDLKRHLPIRRRGPFRVTRAAATSA